VNNREGVIGAGFAVPTKSVAFLCATLGASFAPDVRFTALLSALALIYLAVQKNLRLLCSFGVFYLVLSTLLLLIRYQGLRMVVFSEFHVLMLFNLSPIFFVGYDLITTPPGELSSFLSALRAPTPVILGLLVVFRFFPTMKTELRGIRQSMRGRGLTSFGNVVLHPAAAFEHVLTPLLLRCLQIADQLSVSAVARGAEAPGRRGSYYAKRMRARDYLCMGAWVCIAAVLLCRNVFEGQLS
jgi:energy-coupling factor transport system permease protein